MINPSEENLLGYLIRANEEHEQEELAEQIRTDAKLRQECQLLRTGLALPAADEDHLDPPSLLAERTCSILWNKIDSGEFPKLPASAIQAATECSIEAAARSNQSGEQLVTSAAALLPHAMAAAKRTSTTLDNELAAPKRRWHWLDLAVASSVLVVIGGVLSTQILSSRTQSLGLSCKNNIQMMLTGGSNYASLHGNYLPIAREKGPLACAGIMGTELVELGFVQNDRSVICPESQRANEANFRLPKLREMERAAPLELAEMQSRAGGTYFYLVGYYQDGKYHGLKLQNLAHQPIVSDAVGHDKRPVNNHGQRGQFVGFADGSVRFLTTCQLDGCCDHFYTNDAGEAAAGLHARDSVLLENSASPFR